MHKRKDKKHVDSSILVMWTAFQIKKLFDARDWIFDFNKVGLKYINCTEILK